MTYEENVRAILESNFAGFKEDIINTAYRRICELQTHGRWVWKFDENTGISGMHCSVCGFAEAQVYNKFCGQCGADMRPKILDQSVDGAGKDGNVKEEGENK